MTRPVRWTTRAAAQFEKASLYLDHERPGMGPEFAAQVEEILEIASSHPEAFPRVPSIPGDEVRRALVRRFGYWILYEIRPEALLVLSVWHGMREPDGWQSPLLLPASVG